MCNILSRAEFVLNAKHIRNIDGHDMGIISNLYRNQIVKVKVDNDFSDEIRIKHGVRRTRCVSSPLLFNVYGGEEIIEKVIPHEHTHT